MRPSIQDQEKYSASVIVLSCDRYSDTWNSVAKTFNLYWPDCPFNIYLLSNNKNFNNAKIKTVMVGEDIDWSSNLLRLLEVIETTHVLLWLDDAFLCSSVDTAHVERLLAIAKQDENINFIRLRPEPCPTVWREDGLGILDYQASYRVSIFATIWRVNILRQLIKVGESPWQFELNGTERAKSISGFYATKQPVFSYVHGIEKGLWIRSAVKWLQRHKLEIDLMYRPQMSKLQNINYYLRRLKGVIMSFVPERHRKKVLRIAAFIYSLIGYRQSIIRGN